MTGVIVKNRPKSTTRKRGRKIQKLLPVSLRIPPEHWEKLDWVAGEKGVDKSELIRMLVWEAVRYAKPPEPHISRAIDVSEDEWKVWEDCATEMGTNLQHLIAHLMRGVVQKTMGGNRGG